MHAKYLINLWKLNKNIGKTKGSGHKFFLNLFHILVKVLYVSSL